MGFCLVVLRLFLGAELLVHGMEKWVWVTQSGLPQRVQFWLSVRPDRQLAWYVPFLENTVLRHVQLFTWLVVFGEILLGLMLLCGLYTRLASFFAILMLLNYLFATWHLGMQWQGLNEALIAIAFSCMLTGAGRIFGLDASHAFKYPKSILW